MWNHELFWAAIIIAIIFFGGRAGNSVRTALGEIKGDLKDIREEQIRSRKILTWQNAGTAAFRGLAAFGALELFKLLSDFRW